MFIIKMAEKNRMFFIGICIALAAFLSCHVMAHNIQLNIALDKEVYFIGDIVKISIKVGNLENSQLNSTLLIEFTTENGEKANIPSIEKKITIKSGSFYSDALNFPAIIGEYNARILVKNYAGAILSEKNIPFVVYSQPIYVDMKTCKNEACEQEETQFLPNEDIFLIVNAPEGVFIRGHVITPEGDSFELNFVDNKAKIVSDRIGTHTIIVTVTKEGQSKEDTASFVIEKKQSLNIVPLILIILVIAIITVVIIIIYIKRKRLFIRKKGIKLAKL